MAINYDNEPTAQDFERLLFEGRNLWNDPQATSDQLKDWIWDAHRAIRWRVASLNHTAPDAEGRILAPKRNRPLTREERGALAAELRQTRKAA